MVQEWKGIVAEEGDICVIGGGGEVEGVSKEGCEEVGWVAG